MENLHIRRLGLSGLEVDGELDAATSTSLINAAAELGSYIRLDLSGCTFMDSMGISAVITIKRKADDAGGSLSIVRPSKAVLRVLTISGLIDTFTIES